ncbi:tail fiber domain-containing protein [Aurantiacibacter sediminis]|uniref:Tail fiber domain-containing protein n=1 Tax=Aurantiacibacter sediminis TaxID=2793064 RepID=A0ABS0MZV5_9SPHN|nr:tail fiber domain-containing protein [Aurantiacibacter sediminis]MBH5321238.1 tail fiber domain-containing protein [Aurantiacibacter sediminis]
MERQKAKKSAYVRPELKVFGSVRNLTGGSLGNVGDGGIMTMAMSDPRAKQNIVRVGSHPAGFGFYRFDYKPQFQAEHGADRQFGVMADEVEAILPSAVTRDAKGYARVDYAQLGITLA